LNKEWGKFGRILDRLSPGKIMVYGSLVVILMVIILALITINPLKTSLEEYNEEQLSLEETLAFLQTEITGINNKIPDSGKLPDILEYIQGSLQNEGIITEEIVLSRHTLSGYQDNLNQAVVKVSVRGETVAVIKAAQEIIRKSRFPLVLEELDAGNTTLLVFKILYRKG
jgi:hypothetical protein